jgi:Domain of unknown function (DUF1844)
MSEEQTNFKVTDRRLFNADGTPRDVPPEEKAESRPIEATTTTPDLNQQSAAATDTQQQSGIRDEEPSTRDASESDADEDLPGAEDPASFVNFVMSIASNAASSLGMIEHPVTRKRDVDVELGKHWIDVIGMLQEKTRGNLNPQEQQILEGLLSDLRMQYVSLVNSTAAKAPGGYTGRDIVGGK